MDEYWKGWLAGILDGEGTFYIGKAKQKTSPNPSYKLRVVVYNTNKQLLEKVKELAGRKGVIIKEKRHSKWKPTWKPRYMLALANNDCRQLLPQLKLVGKERQRVLFLEALSLIDPKRPRRIGQRRPANVEKRLDEIYHEIKKLNKRGAL